MTDSIDSVLTLARMPPAVGSVLRLFQTELSDVSFPAVDRGAIEAAVDALGEQLRTVDQSRALLHTQEAELAARKQALVQLCERGLAYARVFAADNEPLLGAMDGIPSPRRRTDGSTKPAKPRPSPPATLDLDQAVVGGEQLPLGDDPSEPPRARPPKRGRATARTPGSNATREETLVPA
jgi:hypothetical protein